MNRYSQRHVVKRTMAQKLADQAYTAQYQRGISNRGALQFTLTN